MTNKDWRRAAALEEKKIEIKPINALLLLIGITPGTKEMWAKGANEKISIIVVSLIVSSFTIGLPAVLILGTTISKVCVPGNRSYETGTGLCAGNGKKEAVAKALAEKQAKAKMEIEKQRTDTEATYRAMRYICEETIKSTLREPGSYERINSTIYGSPNGGDKKGVIIEYRARNGFGGMNVVSAGCLTETGKIEDLKLTGRAEN
jgi:hypothetical protein